MKVYIVSESISDVFVVNKSVFETLEEAQAFAMEHEYMYDTIDEWLVGVKKLRHFIWEAKDYGKWCEWEIL